MLNRSNWLTSEEHNSQKNNFNMCTTIELLNQTINFISLLSKGIITRLLDFLGLEEKDRNLNCYFMMWLLEKVKQNQEFE